MAEQDLVAPRARLVRIGMAAVFFACVVFAGLRLAVQLATGKSTPWWGNAVGALLIAALYAWYSRHPEERSTVAVHGTALAATVALIIPTAYGMPSSKWWLALVGFSVLLMGRRREALVWAAITAVLIPAAAISEKHIAIADAIGEPTAERAAAAFFFVLILFAITLAFRRVAEQRAKELEDTAASLERANHVRNQFLAHMSHEIRTPLHGVIAMSDLALTEDLDEASRAHVEGAFESAQVLLTLLNNLLDVTRIEADAVELVEQPFDLHRALGEALRPLGMHARSKGLDFTAEASSDLIRRRMGDRVRLTQIVLNLVSNAVKYTDHGSVTVSVSAPQDDPDRLVVAVVDTGRGVPEAEQASIFLPFKQVKRADDPAGGAGVGLAIAQALAKLMSGGITVTSTLGQGATFVAEIHLPRAAGATSTGPSNLLAKAPSAPPSVVPSRPAAYRVLVCEDEAMNRRAIRRMLKLMGHDVVLVEDGRQAWERVRRGGFDAMITDVEMPHIDGVELIGMLRDWEAANDRPRLPVVASTAHVGEGEMHRLIEAGADAHLGKPFTAQTLEQTLLEVTRATRDRPLATPVPTCSDPPPVSVPPEA